MGLLHEPGSLHAYDEQKVKVLVAQSHPVLCDPMDCSPPGSSSMKFSRQEYWNGLPFPTIGDLLNPGFEPTSPALQVDSLPLHHLGSPKVTIYTMKHYSALKGMKF